MFKIDYDIYHESGGENVAIYEILEFTYKNDMIIINNSEVIELNENKLTVKVDFKGEQPKINGMILY